MGKPDREPAAEEPLGKRHAALFVAGLAAYGVGFALLARNHPDLAPVLIVGGIVTMVAAFLT